MSQSVTTAAAAPGSAAATARTGTGLLNAIYVLLFVFVALLVLIPIGALVYGSFRTAAPGDPHGAWTLKNYAGLFSEGVLATLLITLWIGVLTAVFSVILGVAIALIVHRTDFKYPNTITALVGLAFYFPSFILAMAWIIIGSPGGIINYVWSTLLGLPGKMDIYSTSASSWSWCCIRCRSCT